MKIDLYTKSVLTVIALCLVWLCVREGSTATTAHAQVVGQGVQKVHIVGIEQDTLMPVHVAAVGRGRVRNGDAYRWDALPK